MNNRLEGAYVTAARVTKGLVLRLTALGRDELLDYLTNADEIEIQHRNGYHTEASDYKWSRQQDQIIDAMIEDLRLCGDLELITEDDNARLIGALTSAPILVTKPQHDDSDEGNGDLVAFDAVFAFMNYQVEDPLATLLRTGEVRFDLGSDPQDVFTCGECGLALGYDEAAVWAHTCDEAERAAYQQVQAQARAESEAKK